MMIYPPIAELVEKTGSRYVLVIEAAHRARQLSQGASPLCSCDSSKEVSIATNEIYQDKLGVYAKAVPEETEASAEAAQAPVLSGTADAGSVTEDAGASIEEF